MLDHPLDSVIRPVSQKQGLSNPFFGNGDALSQTLASSPFEPFSFSGFGDAQSPFSALQNRFDTSFGAGQGGNANAMNMILSWLFSAMGAGGSPASPNGLPGGQQSPLALLAGLAGIGGNPTVADPGLPQDPTANGQQPADPAGQAPAAAPKADKQDKKEDKDDYRDHLSPEDAKLDEEIRSVYAEFKPADDEGVQYWIKTYKEQGAEAAEAGLRDKLKIDTEAAKAQEEAEKNKPEEKPADPVADDQQQAA